MARPCSLRRISVLFWQSPHTLRFGIGENLYGYDAVARFRSAQPEEAMLKRRLMNTVITSYGRDMATANTEFHREGSKLTGRQSHMWMRIAEGWRIVAAHVSLLASPP